MDLLILSAIAFYLRTPEILIHALYLAFELVAQSSIISVSKLRTVLIFALYIVTILSAAKADIP